jgi:hypothetical protein
MAPTLPRRVLGAHISEILDTVERLLQVQPGAKRVALEEDQKDGTADHGVHLWQQGN